ncbi:MAG: ABC transporter ATP-binding protein [Planctomycetes bacterium]|nr:ABC transporter ATP-binding protein [Planctomycetota bacterium]
MTDTQTPAIEITNITKCFGEVTAVNNVSLTVKAGELFFLLGPSGCGKTTLLRMLAGLETPDSGTIKFAGQDMSQLPPHKRGAPMVFQNYALWPHMTVFDNVAFGLVERGVDKEEIAKRVDRALKQVSLGGLDRRRPGELSGGQQQRVVLARALVLNPGIVLLDEPLSNLDAKLRLEMREEIEKLHATTDITFVYVTHDQAEALSLADRLIVMDKGRIRAIGAPTELYHRPTDHFCADFLGEANWISGKVCRIMSSEAEVETTFGTWRAALPESGVTEGEKVSILVRPENISMALPKSPDGLNHLSATAKAVRMNGSTVTVQLSANGLDFKACLLNRHLAALEAGREYEWGVKPDATVIVKK